MIQPSQQPNTGAVRANLNSEVTDSVIIRELEQGAEPWVKPWSTNSPPLGMPHSAASPKFYSA